MDFNKIPKQFCDNMLTGHSKESFVLVMIAGETAQAYAFSPAHAKRVMQSLEHHVGEYERTFGEIDAKWTPGIESPIQTKDIRGE